MACASQEMYEISDELQRAVQELFIEFIKPSAILDQFRIILTREEYEQIENVATKEGDRNGARHLLRILYQKMDWFPSLLEVLCHRNVRLQHISVMMKEENRILEHLQSVSAKEKGKVRAAVSGKSASSLYIDYNNNMERNIHEIFLAFVDPNNVLDAFHKYSCNVLTQTDIEHVSAELTIHGPRDGNCLLLKRLILYENWFEVLLQVLRDPDIKLGHAADEMENVTAHIRHLYEDDKAKIQQIYTQLTNGNIITDSAAGTQHQDMASNVYLTANTTEEYESDLASNIYLTENTTEEYESDHAEMRHESEVLSHDHQNADGSMLKNDHHLPVETDDSIEMDDETEKTQLINAAAVGNINLLMLLFLQESDMNKSDESGRTALMYAALEGQVKCIKLLLICECDVNKQDCNGDTALMIACDNGHTECVRVLVYERADVDVVNKHGVTALVVTAKKGYVDCMRLLLEGKCNPNVLHSHDLTALMVAARFGHSECVKLLIDWRCDVNMCNYRGQTALMYAAENGHYVCMELLIDGGADVDKCDEERNTSIMFAIRHQHTECAQLLIKRHCNLQIVNNYGYTPLKYANRMKYSKCIRLLKGAIMKLAR